MLLDYDARAIIAWFMMSVVSQCFRKKDTTPSTAANLQAVSPAASATEQLIDMSTLLRSEAWLVERKCHRLPMSELYTQAHGWVSVRDIGGATHSFSDAIDHSMSTLPSVSQQMCRRYALQGHWLRQWSRLGRRCCKRASRYWNHTQCLRPLPRRRQHCIRVLDQGT